MYIGKTQNAVMVIVLSLVTCGIYSIYWLYTALNDLNKLVGREAVNPILGAIIAPYGLYVIDKEFVEINKNEGLEDYKSNFVLWILLCFVCSIGYFMAVSQIVKNFNAIWEKRGGTPSEEPPA